MPIRGLITSSEIEPADIERAIRARRRARRRADPRPGRRHRRAARRARASPGHRGDAGRLPARTSAASTPRYAFGATGGDDAGDDAAEQEVLDRIPRLRWVQLPSVGVNQEHSSVTWRRAPQVAVTNASGLASHRDGAVRHGLDPVPRAPAVAAARVPAACATGRSDRRSSPRSSLAGRSGCSATAASAAGRRTSPTRSGCACSRSGGIRDDRRPSSSACPRSRRSTPGPSPPRSAASTSWTGCSRRPSSSWLPCR